MSHFRAVDQGLNNGREIHKRAEQTAMFGLKCSHDKTSKSLVIGLESSLLRTSDNITQKLGWKGSSKGDCESKEISQETTL